MRQLLFQVPCGCGKTVLEQARACQGTNLAQWQATGDETVDMVLVHISNRKVESFLGALQDLPDLKVTLLPAGVMALHPPADDAAQQVTQVEERSPIEIFLGGPPKRWLLERLFKLRCDRRNRGLDWAVYQHHLLASSGHADCSLRWPCHEYGHCHG